MPSAARLAHRADRRQSAGRLQISFGVPEAMWVIEVKDFPAVVTMDAHGQSQHAVIDQQSKAELERLLAVPF
jgi:fumarate hydratase class I